MALQRELVGEDGALDLYAKAMMIATRFELDQRSGVEKKGRELPLERLRERFGRMLGNETFRRCTGDGAYESRQGELARLGHRVGSGSSSELL